MATLLAAPIAATPVAASSAVIYDATGGTLDGYDVYVSLPGAGRYRATIQISGAIDSFYSVSAIWRHHYDLYESPWDGIHQNWLEFDDFEAGVADSGEGPGRASIEFELPENYTETFFSTFYNRTVVGDMKYERPRIFFNSGSVSDSATSWRYTIESVVPEPGTWGLLILGLGGVGAALRRRHAHPVASLSDTSVR